MPAIFVALILVLGAIVGLLQIDDKLDPAAGELIALSAPPLQNEAYFYLFGIDAPAGTDPSEHGRRRFAAMQHKKSASLSTEHAPKLPLPEDPLFCRMQEEECLPSILSATDRIPNLLQTHAALEERYRHYMTLHDFRMLSKPTIDEEYPSFQYLIKGNRLLGLHALHLLRHGDAKTANNMLRTNIDDARRHLQNTDTLIAKMVFAVVLSDSINILAAIQHEYPESQRLPLPALTQDERDMQRPMARELTGMYHLYQQMDRNPQLLDMNQNLPGWFVRLLFKPNLTLNRMLPFYQQLIDLSRLPPQQFAASLETPSEDGPKPAWVRNYVGTVLNQIAMPNMQIYVARLHDLDTQIALFNQMRKEGWLYEGRPLLNPYYTEPKAARHIGGNRICMDGPLKDERNFRCIPVAGSR